MSDKTEMKLDLIAKESMLKKELDTLTGKLYLIEREARKIKADADLLLSILNERREEYRYHLCEKKNINSLLSELSDTLKWIDGENK